MSSLLPALDGAFGDHPDAVRVGDDVVSWEELRRRAADLGERLADRRVVAVTATASMDTVVAVVAGLLTGVTIVPIASDSGPMEREHILRDSGAQVVIDTGGADWNEMSRPMMSAGAPVRIGAGSMADKASRLKSGPALIMYTSGTTGLPKGALLSQEAIAANLDALAAAWAWTPDDTLVHGLPLFHVHGLILGVLGALRVGSKLVHTVRPTPSAYASARGSLYFGVPTVWSRVVASESAAGALRGSRLLVSGSAALPVPVFDGLRSLVGHSPVERYGMTETLISLSTRAGGERRPGHVGLPLRGVVTRLVGDDGAALPHDGETIGELHVWTPSMFSGYLNQPDLTAASYGEDGWFKTGDAAGIGADGFHRIVGRQTTDLIKSGGYRIGAGEVEDALLAHPAVTEAAVVGWPDADLGQRIVAFVVGSGLETVDLSEFVAERLSIHKRPREVHVVDSLPRNAMGKVQKAKLLE